MRGYIRHSEISPSQLTKAYSRSREASDVSVPLSQALSAALNPRDMKIRGLTQRRKHFLSSMQQAAKKKGCLPCQMMWNPRRIMMVRRGPLSLE